MPGADKGFCPVRWTPCIDEKEKVMKRVIALMMLLMFSAPLLTACNTVEGVGKDIEGAGDKVEDQAKDCKEGDC